MQHEKVSIDPVLKHDLDTTTEQYLHDFMVNMAICNTVVVSHTVSDDGSVDVAYEAESPDEYALAEVCSLESLPSISPLYHPLVHHTIH